MNKSLFALAFASFTFLSGNSTKGLLNLKLYDNELSHINSIPNNNWFFLNQRPNIDTTKLYKVAGNLFFDIGDKKKLYPKGYKPQWSIVGNFAEMTFVRVNYLQNMITGTGTHSLGIDEFNGKAYVYFGNFLRCSCAAPLISNDEQVVIGSAPKSFVATDFYQITNDGKVTTNPCKNMTMSFYDTGGWRVKLTMSIDNNQSLLVNAVVESLTVQQGYINRNGNNTASTWTATDVSLPNLMSPEKALETKSGREKDTREAIARQKKDEKKELLRTKLDSLYDIMLVKMKTKAALLSKTEVTYKGYNVKRSIFLSELVGKKICYTSGKTRNDSLRSQITGLQNDVYSAVLNARYDYSFKLNEIEPHERDREFAIYYLSRRRFNDLMIQMAARYMICDDEKYKEVEDLFTGNVSDFVDEDEFKKMTDYLATKK